ncbi:MAG TPA: site-specific integrase [Bacteroidales bacterium]|jgi:integrase|nr:site-specific integrase [Bacteroidales bacterium]
MATFAFEVKNRRNRAGKFPVYLRITQNRKHKRIKTTIEVSRLNDFNPNAKQENWIKKQEPNYKKWNDILAKELEKSKDAFRKLEEEGLATSEAMASVITNKGKPTSFLDYARKRTMEIFAEGGIRNWKKYNGFCNKLEDFLKEQKAGDLTFAELSPALLSEFKSYLHTLHNIREPEKMLHPNTIALNLRIFKTITSKAVKEGLIKMEKNPFLSFENKTIKTTKEKLTDEELQRIRDLDLQEGSRIWDARNIFLFSFYCAGIRIGDLLQLRWLNTTPEGRLVYYMNKNHKKRDLLLIQPAKEILQLYWKEGRKPTDYIFPLLNNDQPFAGAIRPEDIDTLSPENKKLLMDQLSSKTAIVNNNLNKIRELAGINKRLTSHISRHTFAYKAKQAGIPDGRIKGILAHSSLKTTEGYMGEFSTEEDDKVLSSIFEQSSPKARIMALLDKLNPEDLERLMAFIQDK